MSPQAATTIRRGRVTDVAALAALHRRAVKTGYAGLFPQDATVPTVQELARVWRPAVTAAAPAMVMVAADSSGDVVGSVMIRPFPSDPDLGELRLLHVEPRAWGRGIGAHLHDSAIVRLREARFTVGVLWVLEGNSRGRRMYERRGWTVVHHQEQWVAGAREIQYRLELV